MREPCRAASRGDVTPTASGPRGLLIDRRLINHVSIYF